MLAGLDAAADCRNILKMCQANASKAKLHHSNNNSSLQELAQRIRLLSTAANRLMM
jgi:hypothetical protein